MAAGTEVRQFDTCFFERYAKLSLSMLLGSEFDSLVNLDRPDLQSPDGKTMGIEVTRAMEESKTAEQALLKDIAGISHGRENEDLDRIVEYGYGFGLRGGRYIGLKELPYWEMALPMRRILESKVAKVCNGFYGHFDRMGLFVFSKDDLREADAAKAMNYTLGLQKMQDNRYNRLYLADVNDLFVCNLDDGISAASRMARYRVTREQRQEIYRRAISVEEK